MTGDRFPEIAAVVEGLIEDGHFGRPSANRRGRNPAFPYVPIVLVPSFRYGTSQEQLRGLAYATREEAVLVAETTIKARQAHLARSLAEPTARALREYHGLPRELSTFASETEIDEAGTSGPERKETR